MAMAVYGLRNMDSYTSPEVRVLLGVLIHKIRSRGSGSGSGSGGSGDIDFRLGELSLAIVGILKAVPWVRDDFLSVLSLKYRRGE